jgi:alpha-N-arabinofuranosidase
MPLGAITPKAKPRPKAPSPAVEAADVAKVIVGMIDVDELVAVGLLVADGPGVRFRHELARRAIESEVPPHRKAAGHQALLRAALGDSAWLTGLERNSDLVIMSCYAPLFVNVNKGGMQWRTDLIGYDTVASYGSPGYYAQKMFSQYHGDEVLSLNAEGIPTQEWQPPAGRGRGAPNAPAPATPPPLPPKQQVPLLFFNATRDSKSGMIYLKVVNRAGSPTPRRVSLAGLASVEAKGQAVVMAAKSPDDTNSIAEPTKLMPVVANIDGLGASFARPFPAYSITVLQIKTR